MRRWRCPAPLQRHGRPRPTPRPWRAGDRIGDRRIAFRRRARTRNRVRQPVETHRRLETAGPASARPAARSPYRAMPATQKAPCHAARRIHCDIHRIDRASSRASVRKPHPLLRDGDIRAAYDRRWRDRETPAPCPGDALHLSYIVAGLPAPVDRQRIIIPFRHPEPRFGARGSCRPHAGRRRPARSVRAGAPSRPWRCGAA